MILHSVESYVNKNLARFRVFTQSAVPAELASYVECSCGFVILYW